MIVYWLRKEFRTGDNPALFQAVKRSKETGLPLLVLFCLDDNILDVKNNIGFPRRYHLSKLLANFKAENPYFQIAHQSPNSVFETLSKHNKIEVWANADVEPYPKLRDKSIYEILQKNGSNITFVADQLSINPETRSKEGNLYQVFTPFKNNVWQQFISSKVLPVPNFEGVNFLALNPLIFKLIQTDDEENLGRQLSNKVQSEVDNQDTVWPISSLALDTKISSAQLNSNLILPNKNQEIYNQIQAKLWKILDTPWTLCYRDSYASNLTAEEKLHNSKVINLDEILTRPNLDNWATTEASAQANAIQFIDSKLNNYKEGRDDLSTIGTSQLSMALKWGLISSRWLVGQIRPTLNTENVETENIGATTFVSELIWREFYRYILWHNPQVMNLEFQPKFTKKNEDGNLVSNINWISGEQSHQRFLSWIKAQTGYPLVDAGMQEIAQTGYMHNRTRMVVASILTKNLGVDWRWGQDYFRALLIDLDEASNNGGWQWAASTGADPKPIRIFNPYLQAEKYDSKNIYQQKWLPKNYTANPIVPHEQARKDAMARYGLGETKNFQEGSKPLF